MANRHERYYAIFALEARVGIEPAVGVLQTPALPLGYRAIKLWVFYQIIQ